MTSLTTESKESHNVDCNAPQADENADLQGDSSDSSMTQSQRKNRGSAATSNVTQSQEHSSTRQDSFVSSPRPSVTSNGSTSSDSITHGGTERAVSPSSRPTLFSRTSSSTIDIPIESTAPSSPLEVGAGEEIEGSKENNEQRAINLVPNDSYFPDVAALQRAGVLDTAQKSSSSKAENAGGDEQGLANASRSSSVFTSPDARDNTVPPPANMGTTKTSSSNSQPTSDRIPDTTVWPSSKKHGDTPIGMSVALSLTDALGFKLGDVNGKPRTETPSKVSMTKDLGKDLGYGILGASSGGQGTVSANDRKESRRPVTAPIWSSSCEHRTFSSSAPAGKQASLSQHSAARSMEDSLLESWGFTVSTPLCPPKCYPLSSPALNSVPKERYCRAGSSSSLTPQLEKEKDDARRRFSASTPPAGMAVSPRDTTFGCSLGSRNSYSFESGNGFEMDKENGVPPSRSHLESSSVQPRASSPISYSASASSANRRPSLLRDTSNESSHSEAVSSRSNTPASSRHNSGTGSDLYDPKSLWRRGSSMSAQSFATSGTSRSSGVFSIDLAEHPGKHDEGLVSPADGPRAGYDAHSSSDSHNRPSTDWQQPGEHAAEDACNPVTSHSDEPHVVPYEGIVNIVPYEEKYLISAIMEGFTLDNITVAVKSVRNGIEKPVVDDNCSISSFGSTHSGTPIVAGNQTRKTKCVHLVADRWDDGAHFERKIAFGTDADFSKGITARFDGNELQIEIPRNLRGDSLWDIDRLLGPVT
ncbi:hypothetical protein QFC19_006164 [Naganishia cerealis]|uniref:Uncharacterized protein n=1 Tax=Naganishia cerealis TaxID=610337 RepID=A0ACC2VJ53_9TREE|nr:hypothetical protein QFC19_006164 [Naganishia cerealis]